MFLKKVKRKILKIYNSSYFLSHPFLWIYSAYLTLRYVDNYNHFPAIIFHNYVRVKINKESNSLFQINQRLIFEGFFNRSDLTIINLWENARIIIENDFVLGDGISIIVTTNAELLIRGRCFESASGITATSKVMVHEYLEIGKDAIIAWDTFLTDCDWHTIVGKNPVSKTIIADHVWIGVGVKILKGVEIGCNSIITSNSVVLKGKYPENVMLTGIPAKIINTDIPMWNRELIFNDTEE